MKILLIRPRLIGDVVFTTPAVRALRRRFPEASITYLVEPEAAPVLQHNPHLTHVLVAPRPRGWRRWHGRFAARAAASRRSLRSGDRHAWWTPKLVAVVGNPGAAADRVRCRGSRLDVYDTHTSTPGTATASFGPESMGPAEPSRYRTTRPAMRSHRDGRECCGCRRGNHAAACSRHPCDGDADCRARQRGESIPPVAGRRIRRAGRGPRGRRSDASHRRDLGPIGRGSPPTHHRDGPRTIGQHSGSQQFWTLESSASTNCARSCRAPRSTSAATAGRSTSRVRPRWPSWVSTVRRFQYDPSPGAIRLWSVKPLTWARSHADPAISDTARRATIGASPG